MGIVKDENSPQLSKRALFVILHFKKRLRELKESEWDEWSDIEDSLDQEFDQLKKSVDDAVSILK
jgi:hypothetical protein